LQYNSPDVRSILKNNASFFIPYALFLLTGAVILIANSKSQTHLEFNKFHNSFFDSFFYFTTFLGDGITALLVVIMLLAVKYRYFLITGIANFVSALITQLLKHTLFSHVIRPKLYFEGVKDLYLVPGVENYLYNSFPSGHSTCAFSLYLSLALISKNKKLKFVFFLIAFLVGYSRIYLSQHFLEDVYAGSLIGVIITLIVYYVVQKWGNEKLEGALGRRANA
jgi:membrane-associated phospholipid phosphatase